MMRKDSPLLAFYYDKLPSKKDGGDPNQPYHPITNPDGYRQQNVLSKIQKLAKTEDEDGNFITNFFSKVASDLSNKPVRNPVTGVMHSRESDYGGVNDLYNKYFGQPLKTNTVQLSKYRPTKEKDKSSTYYSVNDDLFKKQIVDEALGMGLKLGETKLARGYQQPSKEYKELLAKRTFLDKLKEPFYQFGLTPSENEIALNAAREKDRSKVSRSAAIGGHQISRGSDEKGEYISYYDKFDRTTGTGSSTAYGTGHPFEIYDRIYIDSKTGKPIVTKRDGGVNTATSLNYHNSLPKVEFGELTKYGPGGATTDGCKPYHSKNAKGECVPDWMNFRMPTNRTDAPITIQEKLRKEAEAEEINRRNRVTAKRQFVGPSRLQTDDEKKINEQKKRNYAFQNPNAVYNEQTGALETRNPDRDLEGKALPYTTAAGIDKGMEHFTNALEAAGYVEGLGALGSAARNAITQSMESGLLSNTYKINPWRFKPNTTSAYRMIGSDEGLASAIESGYLKPSTAGSDIGKIHTSTHYQIGAPSDTRKYFGRSFGRGYEGPYMAEVPNAVTDIRFAEGPLGKKVGSDVWTYPENYIPTSEANLYKQDWLRGYKKVSKPATKKLSVDKFISSEPQILGVQHGMDALPPGYNAHLRGKGRYVPPATGDMAPYISYEPPEYSDAEKIWRSWFRNEPPPYNPRPGFGPQSFSNEKKHGGKVNPLQQFYMSKIR